MVRRQFRLVEKIQVLSHYDEINSVSATAKRFKIDRKVKRLVNVKNSIDMTF